MGVMAVALFITIFLLFHRISSSNSGDEGSSSIDIVHPINLRSCQRNLSKTQQELVEARGKICELCERPTKIDADLKAEIDSKVAEMSRTFSALKADFERQLNETREKNAEVERELRSESMEIKAELATKITELRAQMQSERENKAAEIAKLQADLNRTTTFLGLDGWLYLEKTASWYKVIDQIMRFDAAEAYCASRKGHLVSVHSQEENDFVQELGFINQKQSIFISAKTIDSKALFWIGLKRNPNKGDAFEWTDGSSVDFKNWYGSEPDSDTHALLWGGDGKWGAFPPTNPYRFICKTSSQF